MFYVYVMRSETDSKLYTGFTGDLRKRFNEHASGKVPSTKNRGPFELVYYEACLNQQDATAREKYLKTGMGKRYLKNRLKRFLSTNGMNNKLLPGLIVFLIASSGIPLHAVADEGLHRDSSHWAAPAKEAARKNPMPADKDSIARGGAIYNTHCALCHGEKGKGDGVAGGTLNPRPADLTAHAARYSDGELAWKIANGKGVMPGFKNVLTEEQIWDVVNFVRKGM